MIQYINIKDVFIYRSQEDGLCEMTCSLDIKADLLKMLDYKYVIFSPKMHIEDDCYEFLHSFVRYNNHDPNRSLSISGARKFKLYRSTI